MDKSFSESVYITSSDVKTVKESEIALSDDSSKAQEQFVKNSITMANSWLGASGDAFLFSTNTISGFLARAYSFFDINQQLLGQYIITFDSIDDQLAKIDNIKVG